MKRVVISLLFIFATTSCFQLETYNQRSFEQNIGNLNCPEGDINCSSRGSGPDEEEDIVADPKVELRHLIEPKVDDNSTGGTYLRKMTLPKNYDGLLYVAGININTLGDKVVRVRFNFGTQRSPITLPATVSTAAGLTPQTNIEVLIIDMKSKPFNNINLIYDLYDYNDYDFLGSAEATALTEPVQYNRNNRLYCRGLKLEDDNTFSGDLSIGCSADDDVCKHTYAKVVDQGLILDGVPQVPLTPEYAQIDSDGNGYYSDSVLQKLGKCLPDAAAPFQFDNSVTYTLFGDTESISGVDYIYRGPYRAINEVEWEVFGGAITGTHGLYRQFASSSVQAVTTATASVLYDGVTVVSGTDICVSPTEDCSTDAAIAERYAYGFNNVKKIYKLRFCR
jgi:hypothetical protein